MFKSLLSLFLFVFSLGAQTPSIFPGLTGQQLRDSLVAYYKPQAVLSYADTRDTLFARIYTLDDSLHCVYSDFTIWMDPSQDPNTWAYNNGIDTEHTWPQSKGAVGNARSDMHHLYATRREVNSARGSFPFAEIRDIHTDQWFRKTQILSNIPSSHIDEYSEKDVDGDSSLFEAREDHKGNVARAMFYFYTMYEQEANSADPNFFPIQKDVLLEWHRYDPVDSLEMVRTGLIAGYQDGCANPFVLDSSLVQRAYFPGTTGIKGDKDLVTRQFNLHQNYPNPFNPITVISWQLPVSSQVKLEIYNLWGQRVASLIHQRLPAGPHLIEFNASDLTSGIYFYKLAAGSETEIKKMILIK